MPRNPNKEPKRRNKKIPGKKNKTEPQKTGKKLSYSMNLGAKPDQLPSFYRSPIKD